MIEKSEFQKTMEAACLRCMQEIHGACEKFDKKEYTLEESTAIYKHALTTLFLDGHAQGLIQKQNERNENGKG